MVILHPPSSQTFLYGNKDGVTTVFFFKYKFLNINWLCESVGLEVVNSE